MRKGRRSYGQNGQLVQSGGPVHSGRSLSSNPSAPHSWNVLFFRFLKHLSGQAVYDQTQGSGAVPSLLYS